MAEDSHPDRGRRPSASFRPMLYDGESDGFVGVGLVRNVLSDDGAIGSVPPAWILEQAFVEDARDVYAWMITHPERWSVWGRLSPIVGAEMLALMMEEERERDARRSSLIEEQAAAAARMARTVTVASGIVLGRPCVTLHRGDEDDPFLVVAFEDPVERERLWDWIRWQPHRFREWRRFWEQAGSTALRELILNLMIIDEIRAKAAGLAIGGRRPFRSWRGGRGTGRTDD